jgi:quinolinate synthase
MSMIVWDDSPGLDVVEQIMELKKDRNAYILAHNFQSPEVQFVADYVGDALALSMQARNVEQPIVVVCGPDFMVETTKILAPEKTVLYANDKARCPMAAMITLEDLRAMKIAHPNARVVGYINTLAQIKCEMDICCTSSNAVNIVRSLDAREIIFVPDQNLGAFVRKSVPEKDLILWPGFCSVHQMIRTEDVLALAQAHPSAKILVHPECTPDVVDLADAVLSTDGIKKYSADPDSREFIVATEIEVVNLLTEAYPDKDFYGVEKAYCRTQKKVKLGNVLEALEDLRPEVKLPRDIIRKARRPLEKMLAVGRGD